MLTAPRTPAQLDASRRNGAKSAGPATPEGKARSSLNGTRHGLCAAEFFLLPDEDATAYEALLVDHLALVRPRDGFERAAATRVAQARWREARADRLEAGILTELFAADRMADAAEARAAREAATRALGTLLRYRHRIQRDLDRALAELHQLKRRSAVAEERPEPTGTSEPKPAPAAVGRLVLPGPRLAASAPPPAQARTSEPGHAPGSPNRHERRRLAALERKAA